MDYGAFPPEFNSARMYAGPGPESLLAAAAAWNGLAAELHSVAVSYATVISQLTSEWLGPSSTAMAAAAAPYVTWLSAAAAQAEATGAEAQAAVGAYQAAFAMTVPPPVIAENRAELMMLVAQNLLGQNAAAIAANEAQYGDMWAQDATAMYSYAASSAAITGKVTPFTPAPETTNLAGLVEQGAQGAGGSASGGTQSTLSKFMSTVPNALNNASSPGSSTPSTSGTSGIMNALDSGSSGVSTTLNPDGLTSASSGIGESLLENYLAMPGWFGIALFGQVTSPLATIMSQPITNALGAAAAPAADIAGAADAAAGAADAAAGAAGAVGAGAADLGGFAGLGEAASVGALAVPQSWGWAAAGQSALMGSAPLGVLAPAAAGADVGAGLGFPFMFPGLGGLGQGAVAAGAGAVAGAAAAKYLPRMSVVARSPAAGYKEADQVVAATPKYPVPVKFPTNGHAPPGYEPAVIYVPTNGNAKADA